MGFLDGAEPLKITKPIRLIELFAGVGAQAKGLERIGADFEHYRVCEFDDYAVTSYNAIHGTNFQSSDIRNWSAEDLGIVDTEHFTYLLTLFPVKAYRWQVGKREWQRVAEQHLRCFGKLSDCWKKQKICLKFL